MKHFAITLVILVTSYVGRAQQFNTDNYLTMPHGTGTFVLTNGQRNATMYSIFALRPRFELNIQATLFWENENQGTYDRFTTNLFGKYMFWVNESNNGGGGVFLGIGRAPGYFTTEGYSAMHRNYWTAVPLTFPLFNNSVFWDIMPGALVDFDHGSDNRTSWGYTYSSRVAVYNVIPESALVGEFYGTEGKLYSTPEFKAGIRWEPNSFVVVAASYGATFKGNGGAGFELGIMIFTPQFLKKDFVKKNKIEYPPVKPRKN